SAAGAGLLPRQALRRGRRWRRWWWRWGRDDDGHHGGYGGSGSGSGGGSGGGGGGGAITEGREEAELDCDEGLDVADPVLGLLSALVSLLCAAEERGVEVAAVEGFSDVQLEGVGLLLVLLGTQAYGPPPMSSPSPRSGAGGVSGESRGAGGGGLRAVAADVSAGGSGRKKSGRKSGR
ncbi:unnamed protein product, partial [Laminaria digitata]